MPARSALPRSATPRPAPEHTGGAGTRGDAHDVRGPDRRSGWSRWRLRGQRRTGGSPDTASLHRRSVEGWIARLEAVPDDCWDAPTPCREWSVRDLVNHVVGEDRWTVPLLGGADDRGGRRQPRRRPARRGPEGGRTGRRAPGRGGDRGAGRRRHGAPLLRRGVGRRVPPAARRGPPRARLGPRGGHGRRPDPRPRARRGGGDLVRRTRVALPRRRGGRSARPQDGRGERRPARALRPRRGLERRARRLLRLHRGLRAWRRRRDHGADDRRLRRRGDRAGARRGAPRRGDRRAPRVWESLFTETGSPAFTEEESFVAGDRGVLRWRFDWVAPDGSPGHVRGVDVVRLQGGKVSEKLSYVKG